MQGKGVIREEREMGRLGQAQPMRVLAPPQKVMRRVWMRVGGYEGCRGRVLVRKERGRRSASKARAGTADAGADIVFTRSAAHTSAPPQTHTFKMRSQPASLITAVQLLG